jgi:hypothetical protein
MNENFILPPCKNCNLRTEKELEGFRSDSLSSWLWLTTYLKRFPWDQEITRLELNLSLNLEKFGANGSLKTIGEEATSNPYNQL